MAEEKPMHGRDIYKSYGGLFIISVITLFFEILYIKIFTTQIPLIAFFKYLPLVASCFGMGLGCAFPTRFASLQNYFVIFFALCGGIAVFGQVLGLDTVSITNYSTAFPLLIVIFIIVALFFYLLGQQLGKLFAQGEYPLIGYTVNIAGNLTGIIAFNVISLIVDSPIPLFAVGIMTLLYFYHRPHQIVIYFGFMIMMIWAESMRPLPDPAWDLAALYGSDPPYNIHTSQMPGFLIFMPLLVMLFISWGIAKILFWKAGNSRADRRLNWHLFFMGAAFMVVETAGISHLSDCSGSCLVGNSLIIALIFVFMFTANFYVLENNKSGFLLPYIGLALCLSLSFFVNINESDWRPLENVLVTGVIVTAPVFFSSVIFARAIKNIKQPEIALASNLLGCVLGGGIEPVSMYAGSAALPLIALGLYGVSYIFVRRKTWLAG